MGHRHQGAGGVAAHRAGHERFHLIQQAQHLGQGQARGRGIIPVQIERGLQAGGSQLRHPRLRRHHGGPCGLPPPLQDRDHAQSLAQGVSHQVDRVLHPAGPPQRAGIQRRPQRPRPEPPGARGQRDRALDQPPVQVRFDQPATEPDQGALGKRRLLRIHAVQHQLPAPVHHRRLDHLIIGHPGIRLENRRQRQLRRRHRRLALRAVHIRPRQLGLELLVKQLLTVQAQEHEQLRPPHRLDHRLLRRRRLRRRPPHNRTHRTTSLAAVDAITCYDHGVAHHTTADRRRAETRPHYLTCALVLASFPSLSREVRAPGCFPHAAQFWQVSALVQPSPGTRQPGHGECPGTPPALDGPPQVQWVRRPQRQRSVGRWRDPRAREPLIIREGNLVTEGDDLLGAECHGVAPNA